MREASHFWILVFFFAMIAGEAWWIARRKGPYSWRESVASFVVSVGQSASNKLSYLFVVPFLEEVYAHRLWTLPLRTAADFSVFFLAVELVYYWQHRLSHEIRWLWASHSVHHSVTHLNYSAAYRLAWTSWLSGMFLFLVPLCWIGYPPAAVMSFFGASLVYQFWLHTELVPKLGWLEYVFNTPSHHRVHHATNPRYLDKNYGGVLIVFDRLFGTLAVEDEKCVYGLVGKKPTNHPLRVAFDEWIAMAQDLAGARSWRERWRFAFGAPGASGRPSGRRAPPAVDELLETPRK